MAEKLWTFSRVWNDSFSQKPERELVPRDYIWASEIGSSYCDRYLKMLGTKPTNPPNARSKRKFMAGEIWEHVVMIILIRAGLLISHQERFEHQYPGLLKVTGKSDFRAGGVPDFDKAEHEIKKMGFPEMLDHASVKIIEHLRSLNLPEFKEVFLEVKSAASASFSMIEMQRSAQPNHRSQLFHYCKTGNRPGKIVYVNKDDVRLLEFSVYPDDADTELFYKSDIEKMTMYYNQKIQPPKDQEVTFNPLTLSFSKNWKIEYSQYLTLLYGYKEPKDFADKWKGLVAQFNRVFKRCINGDTLTKANQEVIEEMKKYFYNFDELVEHGKKNKDNVLPEEEEE